MKLRTGDPLLPRTSAQERSAHEIASAQAPRSGAPVDAHTHGGAGPAPLVSLASTISLDPQKTPVPRARLLQVLGHTAAHGHLKAAKANLGAEAFERIEAGAMTFVEIYRAFATAHFGRKATQPIAYLKLKQALEERGLHAEWRTLLDVIPRALRDKHMRGEATPRELFEAYAKDRASWRATVAPVSLDVAQVELAREGRPHALAQAEKVMTPAQIAMLEAGRLSPAQIDEIVRDAETRQVDVIVVGAGMAGLAAAQEAAAQGLTVVVLEASDLVGGRTRDAEVGGARFDAGAAWIHATDENPLTPIVKERGFTMVPHDSPLLGFGGPGTPLEEGKKIGDAIANVNHALEEAAKQGKDVPATEVLHAKKLWDVHAQNEVGPLTMGVDVKDMSTLDVGSAPAEEHGDGGRATPDQFIEEGWASVVQSFAHGVPVRLKMPVTKIQRDDDGVVVHAGGVKFSGKKVVMTVSTGMLASDKIQWDPPLPAWKKEAAEKVPMVTFDKIAVRFDEDIFTKKGTEAGSFIWEATDENPIDVLVRPMNKDVVVALVGGSYGDALRKKGEAHMVEMLMQKLERVYGPDVRKHAIASAVTSWRDDPWALGSFTATKPGYQHMRKKLMRPVDDAIYFAGEAMSERWNGMVPGAYLTGQEAGRGAAMQLRKERLARAHAKLRPTSSTQEAAAP